MSEGIVFTIYPAVMRELKMHHAFPSLASPSTMIEETRRRYNRAMGERQEPRASSETALTALLVPFLRSSAPDAAGDH